MKHLFFTLFFLLVPTLLLADEDVSRIYRKVEVDGEAVAVNRYGSTFENVKYVLVEVTSRDIDRGNYEVEVTREDTHFYHVEGTDLFIKMPYCYKTVTRKRAVLKVTETYSHAKGKLIWLDN